MVKLSLFGRQLSDCRIDDPGMQIVKENRYAAMKACDLLIVASGTSTLECAILGVPLLIVYRVAQFRGS